MRMLTKKRKKVKKVYSKSLKTTFDRAPRTNFWTFKDFIRTEVDKKEIARVVKDHIKSKFSKREYQVMLKAPDHHFTAPYYMAATIMWETFGETLPTEWNPEDVFTRHFKEMTIAGIKFLKESKEDKPLEIKKKSPQEIINEKTKEFIAEIEHQIDLYHSSTYTPTNHKKFMEYSVFDELRKTDAPYNLAKRVFSYYKPIMEEIEILIDQAPKDLVEGYSHMKSPQQSRYLEFLKLIVTDAEKYMLTKKAVRKTKISKLVSADKQIKNVKYLKNSDEYKMASLLPINVVRAMRVYTFNVKTRMLTEYVSRKLTGFEFKGTTIQNIDEELSRCTRLRKPQDFLEIVQKQTPTQINKHWKKLTTKTNVPNGRINKDTIIMRVLNK